MALHRVPAADAMARLRGYSAVIDARSEGEFALDALPGARNWPSLSDAERQRIGTTYKQVSPFEARKQGAVLVARNVARHIEREGPALQRDWRPLVYCWRGGQRSGALALVLAQIGFHVEVLEGGYQAFRREVITALDGLAMRADLRVVCGPTGCGKSRLLQALRGEGLQVLDLEALACHRGSVLGGLPEVPQPSQKRFETLMWEQLAGFDLARPVIVESESRTVGRLRLPTSLFERMRAAPCLQLQMPLPARVALLLQDYAHLVQDTALLQERLATLREARGSATIGRWLGLVAAGQLPELVSALLAEHYDPIYARSLRRDFAQSEAAPMLSLPDASAPALQAAARQLASAWGAAPAAPTPAGERQPQRA